MRQPQGLRELRELRELGELGELQDGTQEGYET